MQALNQISEIFVKIQTGRAAFKDIVCIPLVSNRCLPLLS